MDDLLIHGLQDSYYAENQIVKALPKLIDKPLVLPDARVQMPAGRYES